MSSGREEGQVINRKSICAVVAGVLVILVVTTLVDIALHAAGVYPPMEHPINDNAGLAGESTSCSLAVHWGF